MAHLHIALLAAVAAASANALTPFKGENMNGEYRLSKTPNAPGNFSTNYRDYPGGVEYFEVYHGPLTSNYAEVWWTRTSNKIPDAVVKRFDGKVMAIVGIEMDQVRKTPQGDVSVPITMAYNHHHDTAVVGKNTELVELDMHDPRVANSPSGPRHYIRLDHGKVWAPKQHTTAAGNPTSAMFSDGNGGEYRKTMHVAPPGFAQLVESPTMLSGAPMQIDTWNRDKMDINGGSPFAPGPVPPHSLAPVTGPDAVYSGLLECPLTNRIKKIYNNETVAAAVFGCGGKGGAGGAAGTCAHPVRSADACFQAVKQLTGLNTTIAVTTKTVNSEVAPAGCSIAVAPDASTARVVFNTNAGSKACCGTGGAIVGAAKSLVALRLAVSSAKSQVTITLEGPSDVWFGVGLDAQLMDDAPYAVIVEGNGNVTERKLAKESPGTKLANSLTVVSNTVVGGVRTVVATRALKGATASHYTFNASKLVLPFINAVGSTPLLSYHKAKTASVISLFPAGEAPACMCSMGEIAFGSLSGSIKYLPTGEEVGFQAGRCAPQPREDLLAMRNPTCDIRTYTGGLLTCHHKWVLLDQEQSNDPTIVRWQKQPLVYYKKFRVYYQEYEPAKHKNLQRTDWGIAADGDHAEYDVVQCAKGTHPSKCTQTITGTWMPVPAAKDPKASKTYLVKAHFHCHAPTCIKVELWNNDTGALLCREYTAVGGTGKIPEKKFDEKGYIAVPPCLWGDAKDGLEAPPLVSGVTIKVIAVTNNTYGHHGEMALPEVSLVTLP